jgi:ssDNA-binding Zn-finger/Zn-ribbon topoisomerase 1
MKIEKITRKNAIIAKFCGWKHNGKEWIFENDGKVFRKETFDFHSDELELQKVIDVIIHNHSGKIKIAKKFIKLSNYSILIKEKYNDSNFHKQLYKVVYSFVIKRINEYLVVTKLKDCPHCGSHLTVVEETYFDRINKFKCTNCLT